MLIEVRPEHIHARTYLRLMLLKAGLSVINLLIWIGEWTIALLILPYTFFQLFKNMHAPTQTPGQNISAHPTQHVQEAIAPIHVIRLEQSVVLKRIAGVRFLPKAIAWPMVRKGPPLLRWVRLRAVYLGRMSLRLLLGPMGKAYVAGVLSCLLGVMMLSLYDYLVSLPSPRGLGRINFAQSSHMYDRNGKVLYEIYRDANRTPVHLTSIPETVKMATLSIEDKHFYQHKGISFVGGILRAAKDSLIHQQLQGGSTITQQLIKSALLSPERTLDRKVREMILALWAEQMYTKDQILEMYLNQVSYGGSAYGIEEAAKTYFGKKASLLSLPEAALLAGLPKAPSVYSPFISTQAAKMRRNEVLEQMYANGYISAQARTAAMQAPLGVKPLHTVIRAAHFVFYVKEWLDAEFGSRRVQEGGLNISTTLDLDIQLEAEQILREELAKLTGLDVSNGAIVVLQAQTGEIRAMVGSRDYFSGSDGAFNVTTALRQPGSTLKPPLYALALQRGFTASTLIDDSPILFQVPGGESYQPVNYDGTYHGKVPVRFALSNSYNIPAIKVLNAIGIEPFIDFARMMGINSWQDTSRFGLSIALGGGEVRLIDLAKVYSVFATGGYRPDVHAVTSIVDSEDRPLSLPQASRARVLDAGVAYIITNILSDNQARQQSFGPHSALEIQGHTVAVKTGTSNDRRDNLTVGYTPEYVVAVWVGNNDNRPMNPLLTSGITGAAPIWQRVMTYLIEKKSRGVPFYRPGNIVSRPCYAGGKPEVFLKGTESMGSCVGGTLSPQIETTANATTRQ